MTMRYKLTWILILLNIIIFEIIFSMPETLYNAAFETLSFSAPQSFELWRWLTSLFVHANASHLFFNMLALLFFGRILEEEITPIQWLGVYFTSGFVGNLAFALTSLSPAVGASGCIFGIMGATMLIKPKKMIQIYIIPMPLGLIAILYILSQVALATDPAMGSGIAYMAHVGGLITGSVFMFFCETKKSIKSFFILLILLGILFVLSPIIQLLVGIGSFVLSIIDLILGIVLYSIAKFGLGWTWALIL